MDMVTMQEDLRRCYTLFRSKEQRTLTSVVYDWAQEGIEITKKYRNAKREKPDFTQYPEGLESIE